MKSPFNSYFVKRGKYVDKKESSQIFEALRNKENKIFKYVKRPELMSEEEKKKEDDRISEQNKSVENQKLTDDKVNIILIKLKNYGCFKGLVRLIEKEKLEKCLMMISKLTSIDKFNYEEYPYLNKYNMLSKELLCPVDVVVRLYVLEVKNIKPKDLLSLSDPYFIIKIGDQIINDEANRQDDVEIMKVYRKFE